MFPKLLPLDKATSALPPSELMITKDIEQSPKVTPGMEDIRGVSGQGAQTSLTTKDLIETKRILLFHQKPMLLNIEMILSVL